MRYRMPLKAWAEKSLESSYIKLFPCSKSRPNELADHLLLDHLQKLTRDAHQQVLINARNSNKEVILVSFFDTLPNHILQ
jgi:hypothetical protein